MATAVSSSVRSYERYLLAVFWTDLKRETLERDGWTPGYYLTGSADPTGDRGAAIPLRGPRAAGAAAGEEFTSTGDPPFIQMYEGWAYAVDGSPSARGREADGHAEKGHRRKRC
jgi:hypothetical protein